MKERHIQVPIFSNSPEKKLVFVKNLLDKQPQQQVNFKLYLGIIIVILSFVGFYLP
jgi:hypothetical protein